MTQQPFTQAGVQLKLQELYALPDAALLAISKSISFDLKAWLSTNFIFTADQKSYLDTVPEPVLVYWAGLISSTVISKGSIVVPKPVKYDPPRRTKELTLEINGECVFMPLPNGNYSFSALQTINMDFRSIDLP